MAARTWALLVGPLLLAPAPRSPECPAGLVVDATRAGAIHAQLAADPEARAMLRDAAPIALCFGPEIEPGVTPDGALLLPLEMPAPLVAARAAHLVHHLRAGSPFASPPHGECARWVERALDEEAEAYALELRLVRAAGATSSLPFASLDPDRATIRRWLHEHPEGGPGVPALANDYAARCAGKGGGRFDHHQKTEGP